MIVEQYGSSVSGLDLSLKPPKRFRKGLKSVIRAVGKVARIAAPVSLFIPFIAPLGIAARAGQVGKALSLTRIGTRAAKVRNAITLASKGARAVKLARMVRTGTRVASGAATVLSLRKAAARAIQTRTPVAVAAAADTVAPIAAAIANAPTPEQLAPSPAPSSSGGSYGSGSSESYAAPSAARPAASDEAGEKPDNKGLMLGLAALGGLALLAASQSGKKRAA